MSSFVALDGRQAPELGSHRLCEETELCQVGPGDGQPSQAGAQLRLLPHCCLLCAGAATPRCTLPALPAPPAASARAHTTLLAAVVRLQGSDYFEQQTPDGEDFEEATGNEGATFTRWYHRTALVVWPRCKHFSMRCRGDLKQAVAGLQKAVEQVGVKGGGRRCAGEPQHGSRLRCRLVQPWLLVSQPQSGRPRSGC